MSYFNQKYEVIALCLTKSFIFNENINQCLQLKKIDLIRQLLKRPLVRRLSNVTVRSSLRFIV